MVLPVYDQTPVRRTPWVTYGLIGICVVVFLLSPVSGLNPSHGSEQAQRCAQSAYFQQWGVIPWELWHGQLPAGRLTVPAGCPAPAPFTKLPFLSVLSALFIHGSWLHLLGNMLFLYVFGDNVESRMGRSGFICFYVVSGYLATYGYALANAGSTQTLVGASGSISGALGSYLYLYPRARVTSLFPFLLFLPLRFPAWMVLGFWFVLQWLASRTDRSGPGVAHLAHIVGFVFGFLCSWVCFGRRTALGDATRADQGDLQP